LIIHLIIQTIGLDASGAVWTEGASNVSRLDPSGAIQADAKHPTRNRKVVGSAVALTMLVDLQARSRPVLPVIEQDVPEVSRGSDHRGQPASVEGRPRSRQSPSAAGRLVALC
jgi:hypothetical protein